MTTTETQAYEAIRAAQLHAHQGKLVSSAKLALQDAEDLFDKGDYKYARLRARDSLAYSVGIFHQAYQGA